MPQTHESRRELLKVPSSLDPVALEPFSDAQLFCFVESNSRELYETLDADPLSLQLRVIEELKRRAEADLSEGTERIQALTALHGGLTRGTPRSLKLAAVSVSGCRSAEGLLHAATTPCDTKTPA